MALKHLSRELFEHHLLQIKASVPADHIGPRGWLGADNRRCLIGQLCVNAGIATTVTGRPVLAFPGDLSGDLSGDLFGPQTCVLEARLSEDLCIATEQNDRCVRWHQIIDDYFARQEREVQGRIPKTIVIDLPAEPVVSEPEPELAHV